MKINLCKTAILCQLMFFCAACLNASGFALYEFSARGNAMGGAVMANAAEPASLASNPALITELAGTNVQAGVTFIQASADVTINGVTRSNDGHKTFALPNFYATYQAHEHIFLGLAAYSRFGSGNSYPNHSGWPGEQKAYKVNAQAVSIVPVIAAKITPALSLAMGFEAMYLSLEEYLYRVVDTKISASGMSYGGNISLLYRPDWAEQWAFGASYKSKVRQVLDGEVKAAPALGAMPSDDVRGSVTLPDMIMAGISYKPAPKLVFETGIIYTFWSSYDQIRIDYKNRTLMGYPLSVIDEKNYKDAPRFNFGAEYSLNKNWDLRAGYVYDISPANTNHMDTLVPIGDCQIFNLGIGYKRESWGLDLSYSYQIGQDLFGKISEGYPISYTNSYSNMIGVSFKYKFN